MCRVVPHEHRYETGSIGTILSFHLLTNYQYTGKGRSNKNLVTLRVVRNAKTVTLQQSSKKKKSSKNQVKSGRQQEMVDFLGALPGAGFL